MCNTNNFVSMLGDLLWCAMCDFFLSRVYLTLRLLNYIWLLSFRTTMFCFHDFRKLLIFFHFLCWFFLIKKYACAFLQRVRWSFITTWCLHMISKLCFCSLCFYFYPDTVHAKVWFEGEMKENVSLLKILSAAPPRHHAPGGFNCSN